MNRDTRKKLLTLIGAGAALALVAAPGAMAQSTSGGSSGSTTGNTSGSGGMNGTSTNDRNDGSGTTGKSGNMSGNPSGSGSTMGSTSSGSTSGSTGSMSSESMGHRSAKHGDAARIRRVQEALKNEGHDPGPIDGVMGPKTKEALREYQKQENLQQTGRLDRETLSKLGV